MVSTAASSSSDRLQTYFEPSRLSRILSYERNAKLSANRELIEQSDARSSIVLTAEEEAEEDRQARIIEALVVKRFEFPSMLGSLKSFDDVLLAYQNDWQLISNSKKEWINFIGELIRIDSSVNGSEFHESQSDAVMSNRDRWRHELLSQITWPVETESPMGAPLAAMPLEDSKRILVDSLYEMAYWMARQIRTHLSILTREQICGSIEWFGKNECRYVYFVRHVESDNAAVVEQSWRAGKEQQQSIVTSSISGTIGRYLHWHTHDLVNAIEVLPRNASVKIPAGPKAILDSIPNWILPNIRIVQGKLIKEQLIVQDLETETWSTQKEEVVLMPFDPAIILGSFVLTGWKGPAE